MHISSKFSQRRAPHTESWYTIDVITCVEFFQDLSFARYRSFFYSESIFTGQGFYQSITLSFLPLNKATRRINYTFINNSITYYTDMQILHVLAKSV